MPGDRYSCIPTTYAGMRKAGHREPKSGNSRGKLYNEKNMDTKLSDSIVSFCTKPGTVDVAAESGYDRNHPTCFISTFVLPLIEEGRLRYTLHEKSRSRNQQFVAVSSEEIPK